MTQTPLKQQTNKPYLRLGKTDNSTQQTFWHNNWKLYGYQKWNKETINNIVVLVTEQNTNKCSIEISTEWKKKTKLDNFSTGETQIHFKVKMYKV